MSEVFQEARLKADTRKSHLLMTLDQLKVHKRTKALDGILPTVMIAKVSI
jgi:hypothetical protein